MAVTRNAVVDFSELLKNILPMFAGSGKTTETTTSGGGMQDFDAILSALMPQISGTEQTDALVKNIMGRAAEAFMPTSFAANNASGLYNSKTGMMMQADAMARATGASAEAVLKAQQQAASTAAQVAQARSQATKTLTKETAPQVNPKLTAALSAAGLGKSIFEQFKKGKKPEDADGFGKSSAAYGTARDALFGGDSVRGDVFGTDMTNSALGPNIDVGPATGGFSSGNAFSIAEDAGSRFVTESGGLDFLSLNNAITGGAENFADMFKTGEDVLGTGLTQTSLGDNVDVGPVVETFQNPNVFPITSGTVDASTVTDFGNSEEFYDGFLGDTSELDFASDAFVDSAVADAGDSLVDAGLSGFGDVGEEFFDGFVGEAGTDAAGASLPYFSIGKNLLEGDWGSAVGNGVGYYFGGPIGSYVGGELGPVIENTVEDVGGAVLDAGEGLLEGVGDFLGDVVDSYICSRLTEQGKITQQERYATARLFKNSFSPTTLHGYRIWALPFALLMKDSPAAASLGEKMVKSLKKQLQGEKSLFGSFLYYILRPLSFCLGWITESKSRLLGVSTHG